MPPDVVGPLDTSYSPEPGRDGGAILIGDSEEAFVFNPFYERMRTEANVASAVWASLVVQTHDLKYAPDLATEIPTLANGGVKMPGDAGDAMTVVWKLRDRLKWSDGQPLTCDDFKYAWEWVLDKGNSGVITAGFEDIKTVECRSDREMVWHFDKVYEAYITLMRSPLPRHYLAKFPVKDQVAGAGFGPNEIAKMPVSGAFSFDAVNPGSELRLKKNPNYTSWATGKPAHLDSLIWRWYADPDRLIAGYKAHEVDFATNLQDVDLPKVQDLTGEVSSRSSMTYEVLLLNWSGSQNVDKARGVGGCSNNAAIHDRGDGCPMADPAMRQAISFAIDKAGINTSLLGGNVEVASTNISPGAWFFAVQSPSTFDPARARQILDDAGWKIGINGVRAKDGLKAKIELCTTTKQVREQTLALIVSWLKDVGIEGVPNAVSPNDIFAEHNFATADTPCALSHSNFDLAEYASTSSADPLGSYFRYHSSQVTPDGANYASVREPAIDAALDIVRNSVDFKVIKSAMADFQKIYVDKTVEIPLYYRKLVELHSAKLGNFTANPTSAGPTWNAADWYAKN